MTDEALLLKRLAFLETCVHDLTHTARIELIRVDIREERFIEHTLQLAIQAVLDVAAHVVAEQRLGEPATNRELFDKLAAAGWIEAALGATLRRMAGFRNVLVHGYTAVDLAIVEDVVHNHLGDLIAFAAAIRRGLGA